MNAPGKPKRRGPYAASRARKAAIARAVLDIVDESGLRAATTALVAQRTQIPEPSVLYHFATKDDLLIAALRLADAELTATVQTDVHTGNLDWDVFFATGGHGPYSSSHRHQLNALIIGLAAHPRHPAAEYVSERIGKAVDVWSSLIAARQNRGLADPGIDPRTAARQVLAILHGVNLLAREPDGPTTQQLAADAVSRLLDRR
ncbi:MAG: TetR/AcrR family transcriptional regulator [Bifidobacteriaceae bacterium]|nr:TetR/AcrR family transcriptional regulator [Bifidobacteriaceae bacterium]